MSGSTTDMGGAAYGATDSSYDADLHENQIVAVYRDHAHAQSAKDALVAAGVPPNVIEVVDREGSRLASESMEEGGFWGAIKSLFAPDDDAHAYSHAVGEGHALIMVRPDVATDRQRVIDVLESTDPIDFDAKVNEWQQSGYDYSRPHSAAFGTSGTTAGAAMAGAATGAVTGAAAGVGSTMAAATPTPAKAAPMTAATRADEPDTIKVMEERLRVGKREVAQGAIRVRSYVVERPVEEQVRLREERVSLDRRPVDRAVAPGELGAFQERTIEASGFAEEAVVSKEARVVEEIGVHKEASERVETVHDTVRKTEVEVEDGTTRGTTTTGNTTTGNTAGSMGTGGTVTNATPGATTSGMNSPRK